MVLLDGLLSRKLELLDEAKAYGVKVTLAKYDVYPATYYYWKNQYQADGADGLDHSVARGSTLKLKPHQECRGLEVLKRA
ncbi:helix-turn-helix domain-containing protein [Phaeodactylibacter xiamenensis]|uniref:helix-turn-helix domain-containing protein n=1 Tax=Phaeodactylibacter xiamenensis TaxID=1524460 RepID=UPI003BAA7273